MRTCAISLRGQHQGSAGLEVGRTAAGLSHAHEEVHHSRAHTLILTQSAELHTIHTTRVYRKTSMSHASSPGLVCGARTLCAVYAGTARCGMGRQDSGVVELRVRGATVLP